MKNTTYVSGLVEKKKTLYKLGSARIIKVVPEIVRRTGGVMAIKKSS